MKTRLVLKALLVATVFASNIRLFAGPDANPGVWIARDGIAEIEGGPNLYGFCANDAINNIDPFGDRIRDLSIKGSGSSDVESVFAGQWRNSLEDVYKAIGGGLSLGFHGGVSTTPGLLFGSNKNAVGLLKFEAKAVWCIPSDQRLAQWNQYASNVQAYYIDKKGKVVDLGSFNAERADGPTGRFISQQGKNPGQSVFMYAWDAPRLGIGVPVGKGRSYHLKADFRLVASDSDNAWETKYRVIFFFDDSNPATGKGSFTILEPPHLVKE